MSSASVTSSKREPTTSSYYAKTKLKFLIPLGFTLCRALREKATTELTQEIDSIRALNSSFRAYLEHLRGFNKSLAAMYENYTQMSKTNKQWVETLNSIK